MSAKGDRLPGNGSTLRRHLTLMPADPPQAEVPARLTTGLQLLGEYRDSGFTTPRYLVRRGDGQIIQLTRLLYLVACSVDGQRTCEALGHRVSGSYGRTVTGEDIAYLVEHKLRPLGVVAASGTDPQEAGLPKTDLLLTLKAHRVLLRPPAVKVIAGCFSWLHHPIAVGLVLALALAADAWLFAVHGAMPPVLHTLEQPVLLLIVFALTVGSTVFHEFGHASACRYGGARPGCIGCGIYLVWPAMYTDVTDVYRLSRAGRLRTDLGGVYFNIVFMLGLFGAYFGTRQELFLAAVYLTHFEVLEQLLPALRLDGYYILGDLAGVPDLFGKVRPILRSMLPGRPVPPEVSGLKRSARIIVTSWVAMMVPLLFGEISYALWNLPRLLLTSLRSLSEQLTGTGRAFAAGDLASAVLGLIGSVMLILPTAGLVYLALRIAVRLARAAAKAPRRGSRLVVLAVTACVAAVLLEAWVHGLTPRPLPPRPPVAPALQPNLPTLPAIRRTPGPAVAPAARPSGPAHRQQQPVIRPAPSTSLPAASPQPLPAPPPPSASNPAPPPRSSASPSPSNPATRPPASSPPAGSPTPSASVTAGPIPTPSPSHS